MAKIVKKISLGLAVVIILAVVFRFWRFLDFQYWSLDEEIMNAVVLRIVDFTKLPLIVPNTSLEFSLGPFFHWLTAGLYFLFQKDLTMVFLAGPLIGVMTAIIIYKLGGLVPAILYAVSPLVAFADRRWWPLSLDSFFGALAIFCAAKILQGRNYYLIILAIIGSFSWHADPSLAVIILFSVACCLFFRPKISRSVIILSLVCVTVFILPFLLAEFRHPGAMSRPLQKFFTQKETKIAEKLSPVIIIQDLSRLVTVAPSGQFEEYVAYNHQSPKPPFSPFLEIFLGLTVFVGLFSQKRDKILRLSGLYFGCFLFGALVWYKISGGFLSTHYYMVVAPAWFLLIGFGVKTILSQARPALIAVLVIFCLANFYSLQNSRLKYSLSEKIIFVDKVLAAYPQKPIALYYQNSDIFIEGLGGIFLLKGYPPQNKDYYQNIDWIYQAYSLYNKPFLKADEMTNITVDARKGLVL